MNVRYIRDYKHNYLVIQDDRVLEGDYRQRMLTGNEIPGLLSCRERMINGEGLLYYDITSRQPVSSYFSEKNLKMAEITALFQKLRELCEIMQKYLLYGETLILSPEYIYYDVSAKEYRFLCYPFEEREDALLPLLEFLMEHLDNEDAAAVETVYQMADLLERGHCSMSEVLEWFRQRENDPESTGREKRISREIPEDPEYPGINGRRREEDPFGEEDFFGETEAEDKSISEGSRPFVSGRREEEPEESLFERILRFFTGKPKKEQARVEFDGEEYEGERTGEPDMPNDGSTVFIPWIENSEHKLYGTEKKNKYRIDLMRAPFTIGKLKGACDVVLDDPGISRVHAKILRESGQFFLQDMNSTNGCFRNGVRLEPNEKAEIEPGDEIGLGRLKFIYR
ncbi:MAG: FHA domain-containing protein [Lachnospiraceae bacterium]|nr:FHA domain-containing protein [Lachnospiraceae bacterium]